MTFSAAARDLLQDVIPANKPRSGRQPKTSKHTDDVQRRDLRRNRRLSASELMEMYQHLLWNFSIRCMEHCLKKDLKIPSRCAASKTILSPSMRKKRPQFALRYLHGSVDDKKKFMWSDESTFQCISSNEYRTFWGHN